MFSVSNIQGVQACPQNEELTVMLMHTFVHTQITKINKRKNREKLETGSSGMCNIKFSVVEVFTTQIGNLVFVQVLTTQIGNLVFVQVLTTQTGNLVFVQVLTTQMGNLVFVQVLTTIIDLLD